MPGVRARRTRTAIAQGLLELAGSRLRAETLPIRTYTTADGLPRNGVHAIVTDSRGFLWVLTAEGISRFDGYRFVSFGVEDGLPRRSATDFVEARSGTMWVATTDGLYRFDPAAVPPAPAFTRCRAEPGGAAHRVSVLFEDSAERLWAGTADAGF